MTEPIQETAPAERAAPPVAASGLFRFSVEGRRAPALFVVGWLAVIVGGGLLVVAIQAGVGLAASGLWVTGLLATGLGGVLLAGSQSVERRAAGAAYPGPSPVLVFLLVIVASQLLAFAIGTPLALLGVQFPQPFVDLIAVGIQALAFVGVVRLVVVGSGALRWSEMGLVRDGRAIASGLAGGALFAGPVILATSVVALLAVGVAGVTPPSPLPPTGTPEGLVLHLVAGGLIGPVYEEILYRGVALTAWLRSVGPRAAIVRSSLLFVAAHLLLVGGQTAGEAAAMAFVAGVVRLPVALALGWLFVRTGTLWAPIGLHIAFNSILIVIGESAGRPGG